MPSKDDKRNREATPTAILDCFISVNESDRNLEPANVVDGLFAIARALDRIAEAIDRTGE